MNINELTGITGDTICAISTPQGRGGIAVVRVSGPQALDIVQHRWQGKQLADMSSHTVHLGQLLDSNGEILDQVVLTIYRAPNSFTGEDVVELACHGSTWIQQQVVQTLIDAGCRHATAGEFTRRAFANGRMDLSQAEAVADVIEAQSRAAHHVAMNRNSVPPIIMVSSMVSRVVPWTLLTRARSSRSRAFSRVDLPALVCPTMATGMPLRMTLPSL